MIEYSCKVIGSKTADSFKFTDDSTLDEVCHLVFLLHKKVNELLEVSDDKNKITFKYPIDKDGNPIKSEEDEGK